MILFIHVHLIFIDTRIMKFYIIGIEISSPIFSPFFPLLPCRIVSESNIGGGLRTGRNATLGDDELLINSREVIKLSKYRWTGYKIGTIRDS